MAAEIQPGQNSIPDVRTHVRTYATFLCLMTIPHRPKGLRGKKSLGSTGLFLVEVIHTIIN